MNLSFKFAASLPKTATVLIVFTNDKKKLPPVLQALDKSLKGFIARVLKNHISFGGALHDTLCLPLPENSTADTLVVMGLGDPKKLCPLKVQKLGGTLFKKLAELKIKEAAIVNDEKTTLEEGDFAAYLAHGMALRSYSFDKYRPKKENDKTLKKCALTIICEKTAAAKKLHERLQAVESGTFLARDLVNEAPNILYPESYAALIKKELSPLGVKVEILDEKKMSALGMGAILAVGMGSARPPRLVIMRWNGSGKAMKKPLGFIGKGVTFDTGGISIKPAAGMDEMKMDMGGSAAVVGLMKALALQKSKKDVVGIVGLAENMPSDRAYRPGDIVKSYKGKHIEVLNTDAEGRLVLVDCLTYMQEKFDPVSIIDLATLTGAIMVALGYEYSGAFVNDDQLWAALESASKNTGEKLWRMPLDESYRKDVESDIGDVRNVAKTDRMGGSCTAAAFLEHFIDEKRLWSHLDIAGTAWAKSDSALSPKGATGVGVRLLEDFVHNYKQG